MKAQALEEAAVDAVVDELAAEAVEEQPTVISESLAVEQVLVVDMEVDLEVPPHQPLLEALADPLPQLPMAELRPTAAEADMVVVNKIIPGISRHFYIIVCFRN